MILLTGGTGFLGQYLIEELLKTGQPLRLLVRDVQHPALQQWQGRLAVVQGDVTDVASLIDAMQGVQQVVHAAALVSFRGSDRQALKRINADGTGNVVDAALECGVRRLVYVSSTAALGRDGSAAVIDETRPWRESPYNSHYGYTKYLGERHVARGVQEGLAAAIANPSIILGAGGWQQGPGAFFRILHRGFPFYPAGMNGFVAAEDVARAVRLLLVGEHTAGERHLVVAENLYYRQLMQYICAGYSKSAPSMALSPALALLGGRVLETATGLVGRHTAFNAQTARTLSTVAQYNNSKFVHAYNFQYAPIRDVVQQVCQAYLASLK